MARNDEVELGRVGQGRVGHGRDYMAGRGGEGMKTLRQNPCRKCEQHVGQETKTNCYLTLKLSQQSI
jgi:hypothetical protein